jgi:anti-sigma factor RsiW
MNEINGQELNPEDLRAHQVAIERNSADAYLLGELSDDEREAFEEHFFNCAGCAASIQSGMKILDDLADGVAEPAEAAVPRDNLVNLDDYRQPGIRHWGTSLKWAIPTAAAAVLTIFTGYQNLVLFPARLAAAAQVAQAGPVEMLEPTEETRGAVEAVEAGWVGRRHVVSIPAAQGELPKYEYSLIDGTGKTVGRLSEPIVSEKGMISWELPPLPGGSYTIVVEGVRKEGNRSPIARYRFDLRSH